MANYFGDYLEECWKLLEINQNQFSKMVGKLPAYISDIRRGEKTPPLSEMEKWADKLKLTGEYRERFIELAWLEHSPEQVGMMIARYRKSLRELRAGREEDAKRMADLEKRMDQLAEVQQKMAAIEAEKAAMAARIAEAIAKGYQV